MPWPTSSVEEWSLSPVRLAIERATALDSTRLSTAAGDREREEGVGRREARKGERREARGNGGQIGDGDDAALVQAHGVDRRRRRCPTR